MAERVVLDLGLGGATALGIDPGARVRVSGAVTSAADGSSFDAAFSWAPGVTVSDAHATPGGLFDLAAGGLRVIDARPSEHAYVLVAADAPGPACVVAGVPSPCLVPRMPALSLDRLQTAREFGATLSGGIAIEEQPGPPPPPWISPAMARAAGWLAGPLAVVVVLRAIARRRGRTALGRVRSAARRALRATFHDATLAGVRTQIASMLDRAVALDRGRRACDRTLRTLRSGAANGARPRDGAPWLDLERAEVDRLERDRASNVAALERIEAALRWIALRARARRNERIASTPIDPVESLATELALRDQALDEVNATLSVD